MMTMSTSRAAAILDLPLGASAPEVQAAFRRAIAAAHPDAGGSPDAARLVVEARDHLLRAGQSQTRVSRPRSFTQRRSWWRRLMEGKL